MRVNAGLEGLHTEMCHLVVPCGRSRSIAVLIILLLLILKNRKELLVHYWSLYSFCTVYLH